MNTEVAYKIDDDCSKAKSELSNAIEEVYSRKLENENAILIPLESVKDYLMQIESRTEDIEDCEECECDEYDDSGNATLHNTTIEWYAEKQNLNFTDREMMEALNECLVRGIPMQSIRDMLTALYNSKS